LRDEGRYRAAIGRWGNPSAENITRLFMRLGPADILQGLSWKNCANKTVKARLNQLNQVRNQVAHGSVRLRMDGHPYSLSLQEVVLFKNFVGQFCGRFSVHASAKVQ
jgi:hypothetical protein